MPSERDWKIACCNFDKLSEFRSTVFQQIGIEDPKLNRQKHVQDIEQEIAAFRVNLREEEYLLHPNKVRDHVSLDGKLLSTALHKFCATSREIRANYCDSFLAYEATAGLHKAKPPSFKQSPVFVTAEEEQKFTSVEKQTILQLKESVLQLLERISDSDAREAFNSVWADLTSSKRTPTKRTILDFYYETLEYVRTQSEPTPEDSPLDDAGYLEEV